MSESKVTEIIEMILEERAQEFETSVVPNFLKRLGYTNIEVGPKLATLRADYLVHHNGESFYVEVGSPSLDEGGIFDPETMMNEKILEELISRKFEEELPEEFQDCFLEGSYDGLVRGVFSPDSTVAQILEDISPWKDRIAELPTYTSELSNVYRTYEMFSEDFLNEYYGFSIPYPYGTQTVLSKDEKEKEQQWTLKWRLLRRHERYGPKKRHCMFGRGGGEPASYNLANEINRKAEMYRSKIRTDPELAKYPIVFFMDGRPFLRTVGGYDLSDLDTALSGEIVWKDDIPTAVVVVGTWGVPSGVDIERLEELSDRSADMVFYPNPEQSSRRYPLCLNPFVSRRDLVRLWSVQRHLIPIE